MVFNFQYFLSASKYKIFDYVAEERDFFNRGLLNIHIKHLFNNKLIFTFKDVRS
jgi:hypothetical protein